MERACFGRSLGEFPQVLSVGSCRAARSGPRTPFAAANELGARPTDASREAARSGRAALAEGAGQPRDGGEWRRSGPAGPGDDVAGGRDRNPLRSQLVDVESGRNVVRIRPDGGR